MLGEACGLGSTLHQTHWDFFLKPMHMLITWNISARLIWVFFFCNFVMQPHWQSPARGISQIWLQIRDESKYFKNPARYILATCWNLCLNWLTSQKHSLKSGYFDSFISQKSFAHHIGIFFLSPENLPNNKHCCKSRKEECM